MAKWLVQYQPSGNGDADPRFRIFPEGETDHWIAQTNPSLGLEVQEEGALLIAEALSKLLGV
jgi:hypothetical protein